MKNTETPILLPAIREAHSPVVIDVEANRALTLSDIVQLSLPTPWHANRKYIAPERAEKAAQNKPFDGILPYIHPRYAKDHGVDVKEAAQQFLTATFANLLETGVDFSIPSAVDIEREKERIQEIGKRYKELGLDGQVVSLKHEYDRFVGLRSILSLKEQSKILSGELALPVSHLPEVFVAAPVWFTDAKSGGLKDLTNAGEPLPDKAVQFFCKAVGTQTFADFFQLYNRRTRPISRFSGRDIIPPGLLEVIGVARKTFDYTVIATPYHDVADSEWADEAWQRNIDPYLLGFFEDVPFFFMLGRWSGTGLFPLFTEMVADTLNHLKVHAEKLSDFLDQPYWVLCDENDKDEWISDGVSIQSAAMGIIGAYETNQLFRFLRTGALV